MALTDFLDTLGYEAGSSAPPINRTKDTDFFNLFGDVRLAEFLRQQEQEGLLSPESVNPYIRQLVEGNVASEQFRQENLSRSLAEAGVNPALAAAIQSEDTYRTQAQTASQIAGFEGQRQERQFAAGENLIGFSSQIEGELTARAENRRRYDAAVKAAKQQQLISTILGVAGLGVAALPGGGIASLFGGAVDGDVPGKGSANQPFPGTQPGGAPGGGYPQSFTPYGPPGQPGFFPQTTGTPQAPQLPGGFAPSGYGGYAPSFGSGAGGLPFFNPYQFFNPALPYLLGQYGGGGGGGY